MNISLASIHIEDSPRAVPLGPALIASALSYRLGEAVSPTVLDFYMDQDPTHCIEQIMATEPDFVGFSTFVWNRDRVLELANLLKQEKPEIVVFLGGPEATADADALQNEAAVDFVVGGEGEEVTVGIFRELLAGKDLSEAIAANAAPVLPDLKVLPSPYLDGTLNPSEYSGLLWELSRGCPFKCAFCFESRGTSGVRRFPMQRIKDELAVFEEHGIDQVFVLDPTFNYNAKSAKEILQFIIDSDTDIHFTFEIRAEFIDEDMADLFSQINCALQIGLQTSDPEVSKIINRNLDPEQFLEKILLLHGAGVVYGFDLIYGLPGDNLGGFLKSLDFALSMAPNHLDIFPLSVLPGTQLHEQAEALGLDYMPEAPYTVISTPQFSESDMLSAARIAAASDRFYNSGKAVPWFSIILNALELSPSQFFKDFSDWLAERQKLADVVAEQQEFLIHIFSEQGFDPKHTLIACDIAAYFGYSAALMEGDLPVPEAPADGSTFVLSPEACFVEFGYDPVSLIDSVYDGISDIEELASIADPTPQEVFFFSGNGEFEMHFFSEEEITFLKQAQSGLPSLPADGPMKAFADSCLEHGILVEID